MWFDLVSTVLLSTIAVLLLTGRLRPVRRGAEVVGVTPSKDFVPPIMNLDGPRPVDRIEMETLALAKGMEPGGRPDWIPAPLELDRPIFDYVSETRRQKRKRKRKSLRELFEEVPCRSCELGYGEPHECDIPSHCECDQRDLHKEVRDGEEAIYELGSCGPVALIAEDGRTYVRGPNGKICRHENPVPVYTIDGLLVAWICEECGVDGRYPWPE